MAKSLLLPGLPNATKLASHQGSLLIGWYTLILHFLAGFYFLDIHRGKSSDWILSPLFEYSVETSKTFSLYLAIYMFFFIIFGSYGLIKGIEAEIRIYYFPWIIFTAIEIIFITYRGFYILYSYSYDAEFVITGVCILMYGTFHLYLYTVVISNYNYLKRLQNNPIIIFPTY